MQGVNPGTSEEETIPVWQTQGVNPGTSEEESSKLVNYTFGRAIFNNSSDISLRSILLVEKTRGSGENHRPATSHWQSLSHNVVHLALIEFALTTSVVIGTDCIGSCKSNYHTITAMTAPPSNFW
jgi:hypothetical protein